VPANEQGQKLINEALARLHLPEIPWARYFGGFDTLFAGTAPVFWAFFLLSGLSLFKLRQLDPDVKRPFRLSFPAYPILPLLFCAMCGYGFYSGRQLRRGRGADRYRALVVGLPLYCFSANRGALAQPAAGGQPG